MNHYSCTILLTLILSISMSCQPYQDQTEKQAPNASEQLAEAKAAILETLNNETKAALQRDYEAWKDKWVQEDYVTKTYMQFTDSTMTETLGWEAVSSFVKTYIEEHPEPAPLPAPLEDIDVRLYGSGAWVSYEQNDPQYGLKRETRLMEKVDGQWKIAGMHTSIYGFVEAKK
ncbi:MAG: nuclear transport factor 2 family protein [Bacteroidota bacterium]